MYENLATDAIFDAREFTHKITDEKFILLAGLYRHKMKTLRFTFDLFEKRSLLKFCCNLSQVVLNKKRLNLPEIRLRIIILEFFKRNII